jgi:tetratricopeptide (TPR) repeat protein
LIAAAAELSAEGRTEESLAACDNVVARFGRSEDLVLRHLVAVALFQQARLCRALGMSAQRAIALESLSEQFRDSTDEYVADLVTRAICYRALDLQDAGDIARAEPLYDEVLERAASVTNPGVRRAAMWAASRKALLLSYRGAPDQAIVMLDELLVGLAARDPDNQGDFTWVLAEKLEVLKSAARFDEVLVVADELIARLEGRNDHDARITVVRALLAKAQALGGLARLEDQSEVFGQLAEAYTDEALEVLAYWIASPAVDGEGRGWRRRLASNLILRAAVLHEAGRTEESLEAFDELIERFRNDADEVIGAVVEAALFARDEASGK